LEHWLPPSILYFVVFFLIVICYWQALVRRLASMNSRLSSPRQVHEALVLHSETFSMSNDVLLSMCEESM